LSWGTEENHKKLLSQLLFWPTLIIAPAYSALCVVLRVIEKYDLHTETQYDGAVHTIYLLFSLE
jgi:hypothetical protein